MEMTMNQPMMDPAKCAVGHTEAAKLLDLFVQGGSLPSRCCGQAWSPGAWCWEPSFLTAPSSLSLALASASQPPASPVLTPASLALALVSGVPASASDGISPVEALPVGERASRRRAEGGARW